MKYITNNEITVRSMADVETITDILLENHYVVMVSREDNLYIINYIWSDREEANRNSVTFISREDMEEMLYNPTEDDLK